jgi:hypothetical protein
MAILLASIVGLVILIGLAGNRVVDAVLRSRHHAWFSGRVLLLTLPAHAGRAARTLAVDYRIDADDPGLVRVASDFSWWRALESPVDPAGAPVRVRIAGRDYGGRARIVAERDDPARRLEGLKKLRPTTWRRAQSSGAVLIEIRLDPAGA